MLGEMWPEFLPIDSGISAGWQRPQLHKIGNEDVGTSMTIKDSNNVNRQENFQGDVECRIFRG